MSELKLAQILDSVDDRTHRPVTSQLTIDLKVLSLTLSSASLDHSLRNRSPVSRITLAERVIRQRVPVGDVASGSDWIAGQADMGWKPLQDRRTVLFCGYVPCGYARPVLLAMGGSVSNVLGYPASQEQTGSYTDTIREAVSGSEQPEQFWSDLETAAPGPGSPLAHSARRRLIRWQGSRQGGSPHLDRGRGTRQQWGRASSPP